MTPVGMDTSFDMDAGDMSPGEMADALRELPGVLMEHLASVGRQIGLRIGREAADGAPRDMGQLQADLIEPVVERIGELVLRVRVGSNLPQAGPHEFGTEPFWPPVDALRPWANRVLGDPELAFVAARSISETGIEEKRYLRDAFESELDWALNRITQAVDDALREVGLR